MQQKHLAILGLDQWVEEFSCRNPAWWTWRPGSRDPSQAWLGFVENATSRIAEFVRREEHAKTLEALGKAFGWLCCFVSYCHTQPTVRLAKPLSVIVWDKYPGVCYSCAFKFKKRDLVRQGYLPCVCLSAPSRTDAQKRRALQNRNIARDHKNKPNSVDEWAKMIRDIYGGAHKELSLSALCLHFLEEVGEVSKALHGIEVLTFPKQLGELPKKITELEEEVADVFSWIFGLLNKLDQTLEKARAYYRRAKLLPVSATELFQQALSQPITNAVLD